MPASGRPACGWYGLYRCATEPRRPLVPRSWRVSSLRVTIPLPSGRCAACALRLPNPNPLFSSEAQRCWAALVAARQRRRPGLALADRFGRVAARRPRLLPRQRHPWRPASGAEKSRKSYDEVLTRGARFAILQGSGDEPPAPGIPAAATAPRSGHAKGESP